MITRPGRCFKFRFLPFLFLLIPSLVAAQTPSPPKAPDHPAVIKVGSNLVLVPAIVTDHSGNHVSDLKQEEITVLENGKPQQIAFFEHVQSKPELLQRPALAPGVFTNTFQADNRRLTIFVLDLLNATVNEQRTERAEMAKFLSGALDIKEPVCLLMVDNQGVKVLHDFTTDPAILAEALKKVQDHVYSKDAPRQNPLDSTFLMTQGWHSKSANRNAAAAQGRLDQLQLMNSMEELALTNRVLLTLEALREIGEGFSGIPGRKSMIWATAGFPFEIDDASGFGTSASAYGNRTRTVMPQYENAWRSLNRANISLYPLDVEDLTNPGYVGPSTRAALPQHTMLATNVINLEKFADVTGGSLCDRSKDAKQCYDKAAADSSDYYLVGFYQNTDNVKPGWQKLNVRVMRANIQVRSRSGYYFEGVKEKEPITKDELQQALASPLDYTAVPLSVAVAQLQAGKNPNEKTKVAFRFALPPGIATIDITNGNHLSMQFVVLATDSTGKVAGNFSQSVDGKLPADTYQSLQAKGVTMPGSVDLLPGDYVLTFAVLDNLAGTIGTLSAPLKVP
jgi:VWFA-related protein